MKIVDDHIMSKEIFNHTIPVKSPRHIKSFQGLTLSQPKRKKDGVTQREATHVTSRSNLFPRIIMSANP